MPEFDEKVLDVFLEKQLQLFPEEVAATREEAKDFLDECMNIDHSDSVSFFARAFVPKSCLLLFTCESDRPLISSSLFMLLILGS